MEVFVDYRDGFIEVLKRAGAELNAYFDELGVTLSEGYRAEVNLDAISWIKNIARRMQEGFVITIDYGDFSEQLYRPYRSCGTVVSYNKHKVSGDVYCNPGGQDITAHVNFSALSHWGSMEGLVNCGLIPQACFLVSLGFQEHIRETKVQQGGNMLQIARELSFINHTLLFEMGNKYKILIQSKGLPNEKLSGFQVG